MQDTPKQAENCKSLKGATRSKPTLPAGALTNPLHLPTHRIQQLDHHRAAETSRNTLPTFYWHKNSYLPHEGNYTILSVLKYLLVLVISAEPRTYSH